MLLTGRQGALLQRLECKNPALAHGRETFRETGSSGPFNLQADVFACCRMLSVIGESTSDLPHKKLALSTASCHHLHNSGKASLGMLQWHCMYKALPKRAMPSSCYSHMTNPGLREAYHGVVNVPSLLTKINSRRLGRSLISLWYPAAEFAPFPPAISETAMPCLALPASNALLHTRSAAPKLHWKEGALRHQYGTA